MVRAVRACARVVLAALSAVAGVGVAFPALAEDVVLPFHCEAYDGEVQLSYSEKRPYAIIGPRQRQPFRVCPASGAGACKTLMLHRFEMDCGGTPVPWIKVVSAALQIGAGDMDAWVEGGRVHVDLASSSDRPRAGRGGASTDEPYQAARRGGGRIDPWPYDDAAPYGEDAGGLPRAASDVIDLPPGFAPTLGIGAAFVGSSAADGAGPSSGGEQTGNGRALDAATGTGDWTPRRDTYAERYGGDRKSGGASVATAAPMKEPSRSAMPLPVRKPAQVDGPSATGQSKIVDQRSEAPAAAVAAGARSVPEETRETPSKAAAAETKPGTPSGETAAASPSGQPSVSPVTASQSGAASEPGAASAVAPTLINGKDGASAEEARLVSAQAADRADRVADVTLSAATAPASPAPTATSPGPAAEALPRVGDEPAAVLAPTTGSLRETSDEIGPQAPSPIPSTLVLLTGLGAVSLFALAFYVMQRQGDEPGEALSAQRERVDLWLDGKPDASASDASADRDKDTGTGTAREPVLVLPSESSVNKADDKIGPALPQLPALNLPSLSV